MAMDNLSLLMLLVKEGKLYDGQAAELAEKHGIVIPTAWEAPLSPRAATFAGSLEGHSSAGNCGESGFTGGSKLTSYIVAIHHHSSYRL